MQRIFLRLRSILRRIYRPVLDAIIGSALTLALRAARGFDPNRTSDFFARVTQRVGPFLPEHRTGRANLAAAFPEKSPAEIELILMEVWDNLGRVGAEFANLDRIWQFSFDRPQGERIEVTPRTGELFKNLHDDGKGAIIFSAHLANWELPALAGPAHGIDSAILFRRPNIAAADRAVQRLRSVSMGTMVATTPDAPLRLAQMLQQGIHVGMLVDQHFGRGVDVDFFGRKAKANPLLARLARHVDCPIHGVRVIRLPGHRFRLELSEAVTPVRDGKGAIDVQATMQAVTQVIENWVREHPGQWLWLHRRWR